MLHLILIRGLPGSGKSVLAASFQPAYRWFETDMYFVNSFGVYRFDATELGAAHEWCQSQVHTHLCSGHNVVVSNTFTRKWEMKRYYEIAELVGASVHVITCTGKFPNAHNVPSEAIERMRARWED